MKEAFGDDDDDDDDDVDDDDVDDDGCRSYYVATPNTLGAASMLVHQKLVIIHSMILLLVYIEHAFTGLAGDVKCCTNRS